jgi:hypothetical protein
VDGPCAVRSAHTIAIERVVRVSTTGVGHRGVYLDVAFGYTAVAPGHVGQTRMRRAEIVGIYR